jgi:protein RecA
MDQLERNEMSAADLMAALSKGIGENSVDQGVTQWIDTGFAPLNKAISGKYDGGLPYGRLVEVFGESATGKTAMATAWMVEAQRQGGIAGFIDWERSFNVDMAQNFGLNTDRPFWIYSRPRTWEEGSDLIAKACDIIRKSKAIADSAPILFVADSIASAIPQSMVDKATEDLNMNDTTALARVTSTTLKMMAHIAAEKNACLVYLNQLRLKPGVTFGDPRTTPGGKAMEFYASARIALGRKRETQLIDGEKTLVSQTVIAEVVKSKFTRPFVKAELEMVFNDDGSCEFDHVAGLIEYGIGNGKIAYAKPRIQWIDGKQYHRGALAEKIKAEGSQKDLLAMVTTP